MSKSKKQKSIGLLKNKSITKTMFLLSLGSIFFVLLIGFLIIGVIAPKVYSSQIMNEIESNLLETIEYYDITLRDAVENPDIEFYVLPDDNLDKNHNGFYTPNLPELDIAIQFEDSDEAIRSFNIHYLLGSVSMSRGASIEITDTNGDVIYKTPTWFTDNVKVIPSDNKPSQYTRGNFLIRELIEDNSWVKSSTTLHLEEDYKLTVRFDISAFNQNITIFKRMFIYMLGIGGLFAVITSIILTFIVTKPLKELKKIASAMENMDFSIRYDKKRQDEIGQLGKTLNHMMDRLGTNINKLQAELQKEKRTDELRKNFVAQVSHELKTPVAIVSNYTEALLDGVADTKEEQDSYLNTIENECHKMGHIINDLLDLSQMETGTFNIDKSKFDFKDLLEDVTGKYENLTKGQFEFITDIKLDKATMYGDELRIEQAVSNLLSNAIKHTDDYGFIKLTAAKENNMVHIQIENQGPNIDNELLLHIWDAFAKGENEKGAGLGLSITKNIVDLHNGEYYVQNLEKSVVFGIRLPII